MKTVDEMIEHWRRVYCRIFSWRVVSVFEENDLEAWIKNWREDNPGLMRGERSIDRNTPAIVVARFLLAYSKYAVNVEQSYRWQSW